MFFFIIPNFIIIFSYLSYLPALLANLITPPHYTRAKATNIPKVQSSGDSYSCKFCRISTSDRMDRQLNLCQDGHRLNFDNGLEGRRRCILVECVLCKAFSCSRSIAKGWNIRGLKCKMDRNAHCIFRMLTINTYLFHIIYLQFYQTNDLSDRPWCIYVLRV